MIRLHPQFKAPYAWRYRPTNYYYASVRYKAGYKQGCLDLVSIVLEAARVGNVPLQRLAITSNMGIYAGFDWTPVIPYFMHLEVVELNLLESDGSQQDYEAIVHEIVEIAPQMAGLRLNGMVHCEPDLRCYDLGRYAEPMSVLKLHTIHFTAEALCRLLGTYTTLRYLRFQGTYYQEPMREVFCAMKRHVSLADFDMFVQSGTLPLTTYPGVCKECRGSFGCRACRDIAKVKQDVVERRPPYDPEPCTIPEAKYDWSFVSPAKESTPEEMWAREVDYIGYKMETGSFYDFYEDDDLTEEELAIQHFSIHGVTEEEYIRRERLGRAYEHTKMKEVEGYLEDYSLWMSEQEDGI